MGRTTYSIDETPPWDHRATVKLWSEDDATLHDPTATKVYEAWETLFGTPMPDRKDAIAFADRGDALEFLFPDDVLVTDSFDGTTISRISPAEKALVFEARSGASGLDTCIQSGVEAISDEDDFSWLLPDATSSQASASKKPSITSENWPGGPVETRPEIHGLTRVAPNAAVGRSLSGPTRDQLPNATGKVLSKGQIDAIWKMIDAIEDGEQVIALTGAAGTGKTTIAQVLAAVLEDRGWTVVYLAPTGKAAVRLSEVVKRPTSTIHSKLYRRVTSTEEGKPLFHDAQAMASNTGRTLFLCDEGSMVGSRLHDEMLRFLGPDNVLCYLADPFQLPPVADSWGYDLLNPTAHLTEIHRQAQESPILQAAAALLAGNPLPRHNIGNEYTRGSGPLGHIATWKANRMNADAIVLCYSNKTRNNINAMVRRRLGFEKRGPLCLGEDLVVLRNNRSVGLMNGEVTKAKAIAWVKTEKEGIVTVTTPTGERFFTRVDLIGCDVPTFELSKVDAERKHQIPGELWLHVDYAYALTVHKSQGSEYDEVMFVIDGTMKAKQRMGNLEDGFKICYTAITRAKKRVWVFDAFE